DQAAGIAVVGAGPLLGFGKKTMVRVANFFFLTFLKTKIKKDPPQADGYVAHYRMLDLAEPAHELGDQAPRNSVRQQEVDVLLLEHLQDPGMKRHPVVNSLG